MVTNRTKNVRIRLHEMVFASFFGDIWQMGVELSNVPQESLISLLINEHTLDPLTIEEIRIKYRAINEEEVSVLEASRHYAVNIEVSYRGACSDHNFEQMVKSKLLSETRKVKDQISTDPTNQRQINHAI
ncbi:hypothetical protein BPOR_0523g00070 [Botrytis porri]|uniref:Uncharacterized protein n=1 Tax=Botrytis porri TaxID=87229 RepID=A0A4Z1KFL1_9HELO|nr:hypothetical protein BPOR_0523g00070 [Botrytis porri]